MGVVIVEGEGADLGINVGRPIETNGDFVACVAVRERRVLPKLLVDCAVVGCTGTTSELGQWNAVD